MEQPCLAKFAFLIFEAKSSNNEYVPIAHYPPISVYVQSGVFLFFGSLWGC